MPIMPILMLSLKLRKNLKKKFNVNKVIEWYKNVEGELWLS